ncbi:MAG: Gx transporter family protein [Clostridiales bacterium]|jgi:heptaprenyl diphosphate synthase|nr:Gx transporter family protein [Clostridiales bacterium]
MLAIAVILSALENMLPPLPILPPGVKLGLANVIIMYTVFFIGQKEAFALNILKAVFVFLTRGAIAGLLSASGGILSICMVILLASIFGDKVSYIIISIASAIAFNLGQIAAVSIIMTVSGIMFFLPTVLILSMILGTITGVALRILLPVLKRGGYYS